MMKFTFAAFVAVMGSNFHTADAIAVAKHNTEVLDLSQADSHSKSLLEGHTVNGVEVRAITPESQAQQEQAAQ